MIRRQLPVSNRARGAALVAVSLVASALRVHGDDGSPGTVLRGAVRDEVKAYLQGEMRHKIADRARLKEETESEEFPFLRALLSFLPEPEMKALLFNGSFVHGLSTSLGDWFEKISQIIARAKYGDARKGAVSGTLSEEVTDALEGIMRDLDNGKVPPDLKREIALLTQAVRASSGKGRKATIMIDLLIPNADGVVFAAEIKTPKPNKSVFKGEKRKLLEMKVLLMQQRPDLPPEAVRTCFVFPYNPYGSRRAFEDKCSFGRQYVDLEREVLIGPEYWDFLGGRGTYDELLKVMAEVGKSISPKALEPQ